MATTIMNIATRLPDSIQDFVADMNRTELGPSLIVTATVGLLMALGFITFKSMFSGDPLPGVPELKGAPILGAMPMYLKRGMPYMLGKLIGIGGDGISYANIVGNVLVSVHDPAMVREVHMMPDEVASR